jgi:hypothetical protein
MIDADWSSIESSSDDVNTASDSFYNILYKILNDHVPKYKNKKHKYPVWFTPQIIKNVQIKNKLRRRYMKFKNPEDLVSFRELRVIYRWHIKNLSQVQNETLTRILRSSGNISDKRGEALVCLLACRLVSQLYRDQ